MSTRVLAESTQTGLVDAGPERVDLADWVFTIPEEEFRRACSPDHLASGLTATSDGRPAAVEVETIGSTLLIHHYTGETLDRDHCRLTSSSDALTRNGSTSVHMTWEIRIDPTEDGRCMLVSRLVMSPTSSYFRFLDEHSAPFEEAAAEWQSALDDHNHRQTAGFADAIARLVSHSGGRHAADRPARVGLRSAVPNNTADGASALSTVRRYLEQVLTAGDFEVFDELFADDYVDHSPQPGITPDKAGTRLLHESLRAAFPDLRTEVEWQSVDGDRVTTYLTFRGTHRGMFRGLAPTGHPIAFEAADTLRVQGDRIVEHWGVANLLSLMEQLG